MSWTSALVSAGADVASNADGTVDIGLDGHRARYRLRRSSRSPRPAEVLATDGLSLLQVPHVSATVAAALAAAGWSFATEDGVALLHFPDGFTWMTPTREAPERPEAPPRWSRGTSLIVHALLLNTTNAPPTQTALSVLTRLSQARVSKIVRELSDAGLVTAKRGRPVVTHRDQLVDEWLSRRRFEPVVTYWSTGGDLASAVDIADERLPGPIVVSGDVAADVDAPHRRPEQLVLLATGGSLAGPGMLPVVSAEQATVVLAVTDDPVIAAAARSGQWRGRTVRVADPLQILWDLQSAPGTDAAQASADWRNRVVRSPA